MTHGQTVLPLLRSLESSRAHARTEVCYRKKSSGGDYSPPRGRPRIPWPTARSASSALGQPPSYSMTVLVPSALKSNAFSYAPLMPAKPFAEFTSVDDPMFFGYG